MFKINSDNSFVYFDNTDGSGSYASFEGSKLSFICNSGYGYPYGYGYDRPSGGGWGEGYLAEYACKTDWCWY